MAASEGSGDGKGERVEEQGKSLSRRCGDREIQRTSTVAAGDAADDSSFLLQ